MAKKHKASLFDIIPVAKTKFCIYRTTFSLAISLYLVYLLYLMFSKTALAKCILDAYDHVLMRAFVAITALMLIIRGEHLEAVLLVAAYLLTYLVADSTIEGFEDSLREEQHEEEEDHEEKMLDYAEFTDTPVGKAYNPKENYISGIYDFTGHLKYNQIDVTP